MSQFETPEDGRKFVIFVDSMGPDDMEMMDFVSTHCHDGEMNAGNPYVTPKVLGGIYTGENPATHGLPSISRHGHESRTRPACPTLPEIVAEDDTHDDVLCLDLPFIVPPQAEPTGKYWHISEAMGESAAVPQDGAPSMHVPGPAGDLSDPDEDGGLLWNHRSDYVKSKFNTARTLADIHDFDVVFLSIRIPDSYCHYRFNEPEDPDKFTDRQNILRIIDAEIRETARLGDVMVFGDHGAMEMGEVFKINRWLMEKGYLDATIDESFIGKAKKQGLFEEPDKPGKIRQFGFPGVSVNEEESVAISDDPFSTGITLLDGATPEKVEQLVEDLEELDQFNRVDVPREMWNGPLIEECPDLYPERAHGVFVSSNLAEEMGGPEITRSGVHHKYAAFGATTDDYEYEATETPTGLHDAILSFLSVEKRDTQNTADYDETVADVDKEHLRDMGYL